MRESLDWAQLAQRWEFAASLASRMAHDLSNIFTGVNGFAELSQVQLPAEHPARQYLRDVLQASQRGIELAQRLHLLRTCATVSPGQSQLPAALNHAIAAVGDTGIRIAVNLGDQLPAVKLGAEPVRIVLHQLLRNAVEASVPPGEVQVTAEQSNVAPDLAASLAGRVDAGPHVVVNIADSGHGITPDVHARLLETPIVSTKPGSRGLGLGIVFRTLFAHHSGFELRANPDAGTQARVFFPTS